MLGGWLPPEGGAGGLVEPSLMLWPQPDSTGASTSKAAGMAGNSRFVKVVMTAPL
jgi:hypothetical protein